MIIPGLERFDSPVVIINQLYKGEDWGVVARYVSKQEVAGAVGDIDIARVGWHVSVTLPDLDDVDFDQVFSTPEAALEFGINQIVGGILTPAAPPASETNARVYSFGDYERIA